VREPAAEGRVAQRTTQKKRVRSDPHTLFREP
jgi:hypothetical protein